MRPVDSAARGKDKQMRCPQCGALTDVREKRGPYRDRCCKNPACRREFTTCENVLNHAEHRRLCARTRRVYAEASHASPFRENAKGLQR